MLSWVERSAAAAIAGNPPSSTPDEALEYFLKVTMDILLNSLWSSDAICRYRSGSTIVEVMAWFMTAPNHYLDLEVSCSKSGK